MHSLEELGFDCTFFTLKISRVILELAGFSEITDEILDWYFQQVEKALVEITFWNLNEMLDKWSLTIYVELLEKRLKGKSSSQNEVIANVSIGQTLS
ncbi:MAG: hypothetical protein JXB24_11210 [Bacteroidales bacterium]|nr:hypothetical protein [Bacteroidales bacterium]